MAFDHAEVNESDKYTYYQKKTKSTLIGVLSRPRLAQIVGESD